MSYLGRVSSDDNKRIFIFPEFQLSHKGVSEVSEQLCKRSIKAERCGVSSASEQM